MGSDFTEATQVPRPLAPSPRRRARWVAFGFWVLLAAALLTIRYESFELYRPHGTLLGWRKHITLMVWSDPHADAHGRQVGSVAVHRYALLGLYRNTYVGQRALFPE